jgi:hypothetical protein
MFLLHRSLFKGLPAHCHGGERFLEIADASAEAILLDGQCGGEGMGSSCELRFDAIASQPEVLCAG